MNEYSIETGNGKVIGDSAFYIRANDLLGKECKRLCDFTEALDKDPAVKKERISEYKCAKYRYASVAHIHNLVYHGNRVYHKSAIHVDIETCIQNNEELSNLCNHTDDNEKIDCKLYYGISFFVKEKLSTLMNRMGNATDWEKIELEERIGGLRFAQECLDEAWQKRKDGME